MDPLSITASVIALIQLTASIARSCGRYAKSVSSAREDVASLQSEIVQFARTLEKLAELLAGPHAAKLVSSDIIAVDLDKCLLALTTLDKQLDPGHPHKAMSKLGIRALKWPLQRTEVEGIKRDLDKHKASLNLVLQVDQTVLLTEVSRQTENISQKLDMEKLPTISAAEFDSYINQHETECLPGTRTRILDQINQWARAPEGKCIFWLNGMAGSGKSTISRTVASNFRAQGLLGASFFFKRGEGERGEASRFITTIASQLARNVPGLNAGIGAVLKEDHQVSTKSFKEQFGKLLLQPLGALSQQTSSRQTIVLVVDALDECQPVQDVRLLLELLPDLGKVGPVDVRVFLTSRPELPIRMGLMKSPEAHQHLVLHDIPTAEIRHDISLFFHHRLARIRKDRDLPADWPGASNVQKLVTTSVPLFVFAATICRVLEDPQWDPDESLSEVLNYQSEESKLSVTYMPIFNQLLANQTESKKGRLIDEFRDVVGAGILLVTPMTVASISQLISMPEKIVRLRFNSLNSVFSVPESNFEVIRPFHLSFREFLLDPHTRTKTPFWVDAQAMHLKLAKGCLRQLRDRMKKNILNLNDYGTTAFLRRRRDVRAVEKDIPRELMYAVLFWADHFVKSSPAEAWIAEVAEFLEEHFLHWLEAIFSVDGSGNLSRTLHELQQVFLGHKVVLEILEDGVRFCSSFRELAHNIPLQLYSSALVFSPSNSAIRRRYSIERPKEIRSLPQVPDSWDVIRESPLEGFGGGEEAPGTRVQVLEFSPNGKLVAAGSLDGTITLWDCLTGTVQRTLIGHSDRVNHLSFSPSGDGILASSSHDKTVRICDTTTGATLHILDQPAIVSVLAFSPDGKLLASAAGSEGVYLYDPTSGALKQCLAHDLNVWAAAFSPDSQMVATSSSRPDQIILWNVTDGTVRHRLECGFLTTSVAFSPDGKSLLSVIYRHDRLQLWDLSRTERMKHEFRMRVLVSQAKFSSDGTQLVTDKGSIDIRDLRGEWDYFTPNKSNTVLLEKPWITVNGTPIMCLLRGHEPSASAVKDDVVALGFRSGLVLVIGFDRGDGGP